MSRRLCFGGDAPISPFVKLWVPGRDGSGVAKDVVSGGGFTAAAGNDTMWSTTGFFGAKATGIGTDGSCSFGVVNPLATWDPRTQSLALAMSIRSPAHGAASRIFGNSIGNGAGAANAGIALGSNTNLARLGLRMNDGVHNMGTPDFAADILDNNLHTLVLFMDSVSKLCMAWIDKTQVVDGGLDFSGMTGSIAQPTEPLRVGRIGATTVNTRATLLAGLQIAIVDGEMPANFIQLYESYVANPTRPWSGDLWS